MNTYQSALRDFQDYADDVQRSRFRTFDDSIRRFASVLVPGTPFGDIVSKLPEADFESWFQQQMTTVGGMVGSGVFSWPSDRPRRLSLQVALMRKLASGELPLVQLRDFTGPGNSLDDHASEFAQQIFRPFIRDLLRYAHEDDSFTNGLRAGDGTTTTTDAMNYLDLFICHSSADAAVARAIIALFEKALKLSARKIRCTSVDGYRLPAGAATDDTLRVEVFSARLFIGLLTPHSIKSPYVLFELGARWGARKALMPVLARGLNGSDLRAPLNGLNALSAAVEDQVRQLVEDGARVVGKELEPMASFSGEVAAVVAAAQVS